MGVDWLPFIDYWGARRINTVIDASAVGGALLGFTAASLLGVPVTVVSGVVRAVYGFPWGYLALVVLKLLAVYVAVLAIAHWQRIE